jgi:hypothetical protein
MTGHGIMLAQRRRWRNYIAMQDNASAMRTPDTLTQTFALPLVRPSVIYFPKLDVIRNLFSKQHRYQLAAHSSRPHSSHVYHQRTSQSSTSMATSADKSKPYLPLAGSAMDGWSNEHEATATCFCGAVQLAFVSLPSTLACGVCLTSPRHVQPTNRPGLVDTFICNCTDCRKITASMFATNFTVDDAYLRHLRGRDILKTFSQSRTIATANTMTNHFCGTCGTLMYRVTSGAPEKSILRVGTVDDFSLHETKLKPRVEAFTKDRVGWLCGAQGVEQVEGSAEVTG